MWGEGLAVGVVSALVVGAAVLSFSAWRSDKVRRIFYKFYVPWLSTAVIAVLGASAIALVSLVIEDCFVAPPKGAWIWEARFVTNGMRLVIAFEILALLVIALAGRSSRESGTGTLFYIKIQPEGQDDFHKTSIEEAAEDHMDYRVAADVFEIIEDSDDPEYIPPVNIQRQVDRVSVELERAANDDRSDSGSRYAPNLSAPAALAVGYDWLPPGRAVLVDFNKSARFPERWNFSFPLVRRPTSYERFKKSVLDAIPGVTSSYDPDSEEQLADPAENLTVHLEVVSDKPNGPRLPADAVNLVHLCINLVPTTHPLNNRFQAEIERVVGLRRGEELAPVKTLESHQQVMFPFDAGSGKPDMDFGISLQRVCKEAALKIRETLCDYPNAKIILEIRALKTVTFGIGWYLANTEFEPEHAIAQFPWRRLVPVVYLRTRKEQPPNPGRLVPMLVRWDQVDPNTISGLILRPTPPVS